MGDLVLGVVAVVAVSIALLWAEGRAQARCDDRVRILLEQNPTTWWYPADLVDAGAGSLGYVCGALGRLQDDGLVERHARLWSYRWRAEQVHGTWRPIGRLVRAEARSRAR